ncbi:MAG: alanine--tRNA ligase [Patescibacteria group bacterium]
MLSSVEIRKRFLDFFAKRGHTILPSASLVPENDPSVLFNTAGMQPLAPYLLGAPHPSGSKRLVNAQKCVRTIDIDEIGDNTHATFFEMLGNWSLGDYFKEEAIRWSYEFLTSKEEGLGLDPKRLYVTVFEGDENAPRDEEAVNIWKKYIPENRIYFLPAKNNWWSPGGNGPCGPDTEMFYDLTEKGLGDLTHEEFLQADEKQEIVEIWNDVFMEYEKKDGRVVGKLSQKNVDTGSGLERITAVVQGKKSIFETDLFTSLIEITKTISSSKKGQRIVADHFRTSVFMITDGVRPSNTDRGYILRRLLRRALMQSVNRDITEEQISALVQGVAEVYKSSYQNIETSIVIIRQVIREEIEKFKETLVQGLRQLEKNKAENISGKEAFILFSTYGFPIEITEEYAKEKGMSIDRKEFDAEFERHQEVSRQGSEQKFKGGLADTSEMSVKYHTATHLLHKALREVLGEDVFQKGSNITPERLRFDFSHGEKMTDEQKQKVEALVNEKIEEALPVTYEDIPLEEAKKRGAIGLFEEKYGDKVRVYQIGNYSLEFCGGPHVSNTKELGVFKIQKEEAVAQGVRRIKATLS